MESFSTTCIHGDSSVAAEFDGFNSAIAPPISVTSTFHSSDGKFVYSRDDQPNRNGVEEIIGKLHGGAQTILYGSGMAAIYAALVYYAPQKVAVQGGYHGTHHALDLLKRTRVVKETVGLDDDSLQKLEKGDCVWIETPNNPTCTVFDIAHICAVAHERGAFVVVDSTFAPPPLQNPFDFGADMVMHSATKYLAGHSDCVCGALVVKSTTIADQLRTDRTNLGSVPGSLESWLLLRSIRTLKVRVTQQSNTATTLASWFQSSEALELGVCKVYHPSLESHPGHDVAKAQMPGGFGGVLAIELQDQQTAENLCGKLKYFKDATSLGGVESLIEWRYKLDTSLPPTLLRLSIGLEEPDDLIEDFRKALAN